MYRALALSGLLIFAACNKGTQSLADDPEFILPSLTLGSPGLAGEYGRAVVFVGDLAAVGQPDRNEVHLFDAEDGKLVRTLRSDRNNANFGQALAVIGGELYVGAPGIERVFRFDPATGEERAVVRVDAGEFGAALAIVGGELWVGSPGHDVGRGLVVRIALTSHVEIGRIPSPNATVGGTFGAALAETSGGAVVGAPGEFGGAGQAYLFNSSGLLQHAVTGPDGGGFGSSVAAEGDTIVVGAPRADEGRAYLIQAKDGDVSETLEGPAGGSSFGAAVGVDGTHIVVAGADGEAQVSIFDAATGALQRTVQPAPEKGAPAGFAIATRNGVALIGVFQLAGDVGLATSFDCTLGVVLIIFEAPTPAAGQFYGEDVAIVGDLFAISTRSTDQIFLYDQVGNLVRTLTIPSGDSARSLAAHGTDRLLVGVPDVSDAEGRVLVFDVTNGNLVTTLQEQDPESAAEFGASVASDGTFIIVGTPGATLGVGCGGEEGEAFVFDATFALSFSLEPQVPEAGARYGESVAVSPEGFFVGAPFSIPATEGLLGSVCQYNRTTGAFVRMFFDDQADGDDGLGTSIAILNGKLFAGAPIDSFLDTQSPITVSLVDAGGVLVFDIASGGIDRTIRSPGRADFGAFGAAVAAAGDTLLVGEPTGFRLPPGPLAGTTPPEGVVHSFDPDTGIRRFVFDGPAGEVLAGFGTSVALSADGRWFLGGAPGETVNGQINAGSVLAFDTDALTIAVSPTPETDGEFGAATAGFCGDRIIVGARDEGGGQGTVYIVDPATGETTLQIPFPDTFGTADFGHAIAVFGNQFAVSAPRASGGRVYLFNKAGALVRTFQSPLGGGAFGQSIANVEGLLMIGEPGTAAYLFQLDGTLVRTFTSPPLAGGSLDAFGFAVRGAGNFVAISAVQRDNPDQTFGAVFVFDRTNGNLLSTLNSPTGSNFQFGNWLTIHNGTTLVVSDPFDTGSGGALHLFDLASGSFLRTINAPNGGLGLGQVRGFGRETIQCGEFLLVGQVPILGSGAAFLFDILGNEVFCVESFNPSLTDRFGLGLGCLNGAPIVGAPGANVNPNGAGRVTFLAGFQQQAPPEDPTFSAALTLTSPEPQTSGFFSDSVAFVGNDIAVGASLERPQIAGTGFLFGAVHIYRGSDGAFQRTIRTPNVNGSQRFGVSLSANATVLAVGSPGEPSGGVAAGRAYLFSPITGQVLIAFDPPNPEDGAGFGSNVSLSVANLLIGEPGATVNGFDSAGRAHYFDCAVNQVLQSFESPDPETNGNFGTAVATCGTRVYVGAHGEDDFNGRAYCFDGLTGQLIHTFDAPAGATLFGITMAKFGNDILIGAPGGIGSVFLFSGATGQLLRTFDNPIEVPCLFGQSIASNGSEVIIGAPEGAGGGSAHIFDGDTASLIRTVESPDPEEGANFGESVAMFGNNHIIGALLADGGAVDAGAAFVNVSEDG